MDLLSEVYRTKLLADLKETLRARLEKNGLLPVERTAKPHNDQAQWEQAFLSIQAATDDELDDESPAGIAIPQSRRTRREVLVDGGENRSPGSERRPVQSLRASQEDPNGSIPPPPPSHPPPASLTPSSSSH